MAIAKVLAQRGDFDLIELYERKQSRPDVERARARLEALAS
jgi:hypothetical protein